MKETFIKIIAEDLTSCLSLISVPTLIIWGEKDRITPLSDGYLMKEKIAQSELKIIPGQGHAFHHEAPEEIAREILQFISRNN
jgi:pimeloyl-ACP methyl ester carboxylesterase